MGEEGIFAKICFCNISSIKLLISKPKQGATNVGSFLPEFCKARSTCVEHLNAITSVQSSNRSKAASMATFPLLIYIKIM